MVEHLPSVCEVLDLDSQYWENYFVSSSCSTFVLLFIACVLVTHYKYN